MTPLARHRLIALSVFFAAQLALVIGVGAFDAWIEYAWGDPSTITVALRNVHPMISHGYVLAVGLTVGLLAGHFWWNSPPSGKAD